MSVDEYLVLIGELLLPGEVVRHCDTEPLVIHQARDEHLCWLEDLEVGQESEVHHS